MGEIAAEALLEGPRGRRLCFELAQAALHARAQADPAEQWRASAVFYAAYAADPGAGRSRVLFGPSGNRVPQGFGGIDLAAQALVDLELPEITEGALFQALIASVDLAAYWQPPGGEDVLAASPELREPLLRIAERIAQAPATAWWTSGLDGTAGDGAIPPQWTVAWDEMTADPPADTPAGVLRHWGVRVRQMEARAQLERPMNPEARWSGEWWCTPPYGLVKSTRALGERGPLGLHLVEDSLGWERAIARPVGVLPEAKVTVIRGPEDWAALCREAPLDVTAEKRHDWYRTTGRDGAWVMPDWERVAEHTDGVHLTTLGYLRSAGRAIDLGDGRASVIAGWSPDETYWLTDRVRVWDEPVHWERAEPNTHPDSDAWRRVD